MIDAFISWLCAKLFGGNGAGCQGGDCPPMATYTFAGPLNILAITATPVRYAPPRGPTVAFQIVYNQREATQPAIFTFSNLGTRWTFGWQSWIEDHPTDPFQPLEVVLRGKSH